MVQRLGPAGKAKAERGYPGVTYSSKFFASTQFLRTKNSFICYIEKTEKNLKSTFSQHSPITKIYIVLIYYNI